MGWDVSARVVERVRGLRTQYSALSDHARRPVWSFHCAVGHHSTDWLAPRELLYFSLCKCSRLLARANSICSYGAILNHLDWLS